MGQLTRPGFVEGAELRYGMADLRFDHVVLEGKLFGTRNSRPERSVRACVALLAVLLLAVGGCRSASSPTTDNARPPPTSPTDDDAAGAESATAAAPAPAPGGKGGADAPPPAAQPFDDSACQHVPVKADCENDFCRIPAGCFVMGAPEDEPGFARVQEARTIVTLTRDFVVQRTEVMRAQWLELGLPDPSAQAEDGSGNCKDDEQCPIGNVTWFEALAFANLTSQRHDPPLAPCYALHDCSGELGRGTTCLNATVTAPSVYACEGFRLPTDAEWEYAARAGTRSAFHSGDMRRPPELSACAHDPSLDAIAWYCDNAGGRTHPAAQRAPNGFGLFDMSGNVSEWVNDRDTGRPPEVSSDPGALLELAGSVVHPARVRRGGDYLSWPVLCRSAWHHVGLWGSRSARTGLRLARTLPAESAGQ